MGKGDSKVRESPIDIKVRSREKDSTIEGKE